MNSVMSYMYRLAALGGADKNYELQQAAALGQNQRVKDWLDAGAKADAGDNAAIRMASANGQTETVKILAAAGADAGAVNPEHAERNGHLETANIVRTLAAVPAGP
jgi:hypothetical protein